MDFFLELTLGLLAVAILTGVGVYVARTRQAAREQSWERAVSLLAEVYSLSVGRRCQLGMASGETDFGHLVIEPVPGRASSEPTTTQVHLTIPGLSKSVVIGVCPWHGSIGGTTDSILDTSIFISYTDGLSLLDHPLRERLVKAFKTNRLPTIRDGRVSASLGSLPDDERQLISLVHRVMDMGKELAPRLERPEPERLADILEHDPVRLVREKAAKVLLETWPMDPRAAAAADVAMRSQGLELRILAAGYLQTDQAREILMDAALGGASAATQAATALRVMARDPEAAAMAPAVLAQFGRLSGVRLIAALEFLHAAGSLPSLEALELRSNSVGRDERLAIVAAANRHGTAGRPLLLKLAQDRSKDVAINALRTLGLAGDVSTIEALIEIERSAPSYALWVATGKAIQAIQRREGVSAGAGGGLAMAQQDVATGGLSAYRGESGAVHIADD